MSRRKQIIISLVIALIILIFVNILYNSTVEKQISVYVIKDTILKGEEISAEKLSKLSINEKEISGLKVIAYGELPNNSFADKQLNKGQILTFNEVRGSKLEQEYEYISILADKAEQAVAYDVGRGDYINVYYTASKSDMAIIMGNKFDEQKVYSSSAEDAIVTYKLYENIQIVNTLDSAGNVIEKGQFSQIVIKIPKADGLTIVNLASLGEFYITKQE